MNVLTFRAFMDELEKLGASASTMLMNAFNKRNAQLVSQGMKPLGEMGSIKQVARLEKVPEMRSRAGQIAMSTRQALKSPSTIPAEATPWAGKLTPTGSV